MEERSIEQMELSGRSLKELWTAARWAKLLSIMTVSLYFIMIILTIFGGIITALFSMVMPFGGFIIAVIYITIYSLSMLVPGIMLYNFADKTQKAIIRNDDDLATTGIKRLRQLFQYAGIMTIITILLIGISIVATVVASVF